jgi:hypothetical protein
MAGPPCLSRQQLSDGNWPTPYYRRAINDAFDLWRPDRGMQTLSTVGEYPLQQLRLPHSTSSESVFLPMACLTLASVALQMLALRQ